MLYIPLDLSLSVLLFGTYLLTIMCLLRIMKTTSPAIVVCGSSVLIYIVGLVLISMVGLKMNFFSFSSLYWFLTLSLLMIFGAVYKSISLRMLLHLMNQPKKYDYYDAILQNYIKDQSYTNRISILIEKKMIAARDMHSYCLTKKGALFARALWVIQQAFSIRESG